MVGGRGADSADAVDAHDDADAPRQCICVLFLFMFRLLVRPCLLGLLLLVLWRRCQCVCRLLQACLLAGWRRIAGIVFCIRGIGSDDTTVLLILLRGNQLQFSFEKVLVDLLLVLGSLRGRRRERERRDISKGSINGMWICSSSAFRDLTHNNFFAQNEFANFVRGRRVSRGHSHLTLTCSRPPATVTVGFIARGDAFFGIYCLFQFHFQFFELFENRFDSILKSRLKGGNGILPDASSVKSFYGLGTCASVCARER